MKAKIKEYFKQMDYPMQAYINGVAANTPSYERPARADFGKAEAVILGFMFGAKDASMTSLTTLIKYCHNQLGIGPVAVCRIINGSYNDMDRTIF